MKDLQNIIGDIVLTKHDGTKVTISTSDSKFADSDFSDNTYELFNFTDTASYGKGSITIEYIVEIPDNESAQGIKGTKQITNNVEVTGTNKSGSSSTNFNVNFGDEAKPTIEKTFVNLDEDEKKFEWKIKVSNPGSDDLENVYVTDSPSNNANSTDSIDWNDIVVKDSSDSVVDSSKYSIVENVPNSSISKAVKFDIIPADTDYYIYITTTTSKLVNAKTYKNTASIFYANMYYRDEESSAEKKYSTNEFDMTKSCSYDEATETYTWTVVVNSEKNTYEPDSKLYFVDNLPDGMEYVPNSMNVAFDGKITINGVEGTTGYHRFNIEPSINGNNIGPVDVSSLISGTNTYGTNNYVVGINELKSTFTYKTKITDSEKTRIQGLINTQTSFTYTNTAKVTDETGNTVLQSATSDATYDYKVLTKKDLGSDKDNVKFQIIINPDELMLNGGEALKLTDTLETTIELLFGGDSALTVKDKNGIDMIADGRAKASYNDDERTITIYVPDQTKVIVNYSVATRKTGDILVKNEALLVGGGKNYSDQIIIWILSFSWTNK